MKKKALKITALVAALALIIILGLFANSMVGNPISHMLAKRTAERYLEEHHPDKDYQLEGVTFNFKFVCYNAYFQSPSSPDSRFTLMLGMDGQVKSDYYEEQVTNRGNTARRLEEEYRSAVSKVLDSPAFPYDTHIDYGELQFISEEFRNAEGVPAYALITNELELDGIYDVNELGAKAGKLTVYVYDDTVTVERLAEIILDIRAMLEEAGVSFYVMDCVLEYPKPEDGSPWKEGRVEVMEMRCSDIYEEGLVDRVRTSNESAADYYEKMDAIKKQEEIG